MGFCRIRALPVGYPAIGKNQNNFLSRTKQVLTTDNTDGHGSKNNGFSVSWQNDIRVYLCLSVVKNHPLKPNCFRCFHNSLGLKMPAGMMMPVINSGGVTSNPGFRAWLFGFAVRT